MNKIFLTYIALSLLLSGCFSEFHLFVPGPFAGSAGTVVYYPQERKSFDVFNVRLDHSHVLSDAQFVDLLGAIQPKLNKDKKYILFTSNNVDSQWAKSFGYLVKVEDIISGRSLGIKDIEVIENPEVWDQELSDWNFKVPGEFREVKHNYLNDRKPVMYDARFGSDEYGRNLKPQEDEILTKYGEPHCVIVRSDGKWLVYNAIWGNHKGRIKFCIDDNGVTVVKGANFQ